MPDVPEQHSGIFETLQEFDPFDVVLAVVPPSGRVPVYTQQALFS